MNFFQVILKTYEFLKFQVSRRSENFSSVRGGGGEGRGKS